MVELEGLEPTQSASYDDILKKYSPVLKKSESKPISTIPKRNCHDPNYKLPNYKNEQTFGQWLEEDGQLIDVGLEIIPFGATFSNHIKGKEVTNEDVAWEVAGIIPVDPPKTPTV